MLRPCLSGMAAIALLTGCGPAETRAADAPAPAPQTPITPPPPPADPLNIGPQDARDDLYCGGLIFAAYPTPTSALSPTDEARLMKTQNFGLILAENGFDKLIKQGLAHATHAAVISQAYTNLAAADLAADTTRMELAACITRAEALRPIE